MNNSELVTSEDPERLLHVYNEILASTFNTMLDIGETRIRSSSNALDVSICCNGHYIFLDEYTVGTDSYKATILIKMPREFAEEVSRDGENPMTLSRLISADIFEPSYLPLSLCTGDALALQDVVSKILKKIELIKSADDFEVANSPKFSNPNGELAYNPKARKRTDQSTLKPSLISLRSSSQHNQFEQIYKGESLDLYILNRPNGGGIYIFKSRSHDWESIEPDIASFNETYPDIKFDVGIIEGYNNTFASDAKGFTGSIKSKVNIDYFINASPLSSYSMRLFIKEKMKNGLAEIAAEARFFAAWAAYSMVQGISGSDFEVNWRLNVKADDKDRIERITRHMQFNNTYQQTVEEDFSKIIELTDASNMRAINSLLGKVDGNVAVYVGEAHFENFLKLLMNT